MPRKKVGKRKDPPIFRKPFPASSPEKASVAPADPITPREEKKTKMKTKFGQTLASMDPGQLKNLLDDCMAQSLVPKEPVDRAIYKRLEQDGRKVKRFRRSLVEIILDEATEDHASVPTPEVQHHPDPGLLTNPTATEKAVFKLNLATDSEDVVEAGSSHGGA
ncbi:hypothetical protein FRC00_000812 [Tulasnella sp. 408]|nr:hypothetical protein FRC00_000812 [Tulasnella sp. 408]